MYTLHIVSVSDVFECLPYLSICICTYPIIITQLTVSGWLVFIPKKNHTQCIYWIYTRPPPINIQFPYIFQICLQFQIAIIMHTNHSQVTHQTETPRRNRVVEEEEEKMQRHHHRINICIIMLLCAHI